VTRDSARRFWLAIAAGIALTAVAVLLGNWQTRRGHEKEARQIQWERAGNANPVSLQTDSELEAALGQLPLRVALRGEFEPRATVFVDNRALEGIAGFQVVTPLRLASGTAVLINRGWVARDRDQADRRAVTVRALRGRGAEVLRLYSGMNVSMDQICAGYTDTELELLADFLRRTAEAGRAATDALAGD